MERKSKANVETEVALLKRSIEGARARLGSHNKLPERASVSLLNQIPIWEARLAKLQSGR
jgi:hypothetical protein